MLSVILKTLDYFLCVDMIWGIWAQFVQIVLMPKYLQNKYTTQPLEGLDTRLKTNLMWNKDLKTWGYFSCVPACDGVFIASFPKLPLYFWSPVKQV